MQNMWRCYTLQTRITLFHFVVISFLFSEQKTLQIWLHHTRPGLKSWSKQNLKYFAIFTFTSNLNLGQFFEHIFLHTANCIWQRVSILVAYFNHQCHNERCLKIQNTSWWTFLLLVHIALFAWIITVFFSFLKSPHVPWPLKTSSSFFKAISFRKNI